MAAGEWDSWSPHAFEIGQRLQREIDELKKRIEVLERHTPRIGAVRCAVCGGWGRQDQDVVYRDSKFVHRNPCPVERRDPWSL